MKKLKAFYPNQYQEVQISGLYENRWGKWAFAGYFKPGNAYEERGKGHIYQ